MPTIPHKVFSGICSGRNFPSIGRSEWYGIGTSFCGKIFLVALCCFEYKIAAGDDANAIITKMLECREKQTYSIIKYINSLPKTAILVSIDEVTKTESGTEQSTELKLCSKQPEGGFLMNFRSHGGVTAYLLNQRYTATLSKSFETPLISSVSSKVDLNQLKDCRMSMSGFSRPDTEWIDQIFPDAMTRVYFSYGGRSLKEFHSNWAKRSEHSVILSESKIPDCVDLVFQGWPETTGPAVYSVDSGGVVHEINISRDKYNGVLRVEEFIELNGVKIPKKLVSRLSFSDKELEGTSTCSWKEIPLTDLGYDPTQLYTTYYGLAEPDLRILPKSSWRAPWLYLIGSALITGGLIYYAVRFKNKKY